MHYYQTIIYLLNSYGYLAMFGVIFLAEIGIALPIPVPSELMLLYAGYRIYLHKMDIYNAMLAGVAGDFLGSLILFLIFYHLKDLRILSRVINKLHKDSFFIKTKNSLSEHGAIIISFGRLVPYLRYYITIISGVLDIPPQKFMPFSLVASLIWTYVIIYIGIKLGPDVLKAQATLGNYELASVLISITIALFFMYYVIRIFTRKE